MSLRLDISHKLYMEKEGRYTCIATDITRIVHALLYLNIFQLCRPTVTGDRRRPRVDCWLIIYWLLRHFLGERIAGVYPRLIPFRWFQRRRRALAELRRRCLHLLSLKPMKASCRHWRSPILCRRRRSSLRAEPNRRQAHCLSGCPRPPCRRPACEGISADDVHRVDLQLS